MTKNLLRLAVPASAILLASAPFAFAQPTVPPSPINSINAVFASNGPLCRVFRYLFIFLIILTVIFVVVAAYKYLTSAGDPEKVKSANHQIIYAGVAIAVALIAKAIPTIVSTFLKATSPLAAC